jgi:hypothetical protein
MSELAFLAIAAVAAAFKALAIIFGLLWVFRHLISDTYAPLNYRHTHTQIPYRPSNRHH